MAHAIIRGANGRRHEVDFEGMEITVEVCFGNETVEIAVEAPAPAPRRIEEADELLMRGCMQRPMTVPSRTFNAANSVVVPLRL